MDTDHVDYSDVPKDTFFLEQTSQRQRVKRKKKQLDDLPADLRGGRFFLGKGRHDHEDLDDSGINSSRSSLLPQINEAFNLIRSRLNASMINDENSQRFIYEETKRNALDVLIALAKILYNFKSRPVNFSKKLEIFLTSSYLDLTIDVQFVVREWQIPANREEYLRKMEQEEGQKEELTPHDSIDKISIVSGVKSHTDDDARSIASLRSLRSVKDAPSSSADLAASSSKQNISRPLDAIVENVHESSVRVPSTRESEPVQGSFTNINVDGFNAFARRKSRLERFKLGSFDNNKKVSKVSVQRKSLRLDDALSAFAESLSEKCWIVHPSNDKERETLMDWTIQQARQQLQAAIKNKKAEEQLAKQQGQDKPVVLRYYGDSQEKRRNVTRSAPQLSRGRIRIPIMADHDRNHGKLFMTTVPDGSTTIYYPSGQQAVVSTSAGFMKPGYYTLVYDDTSDNKMLGCFTASGRGCCYYDSGIVRFLVTDTGGTLADEKGAIVKRWNWPGHDGKLTTSVVFSVSPNGGHKIKEGSQSKTEGTGEPNSEAREMNPYMTVRCLSRTKITLYFECQKENAKVALGATLNADEPKTRAELGYLQTNVTFESQAAKSATKTSFKQGMKKEKKKPPKKEKKNPLLQKPEIQLLIDMPEVTINDAEADTNLLKLQRKVKNLVDDWLEHYRIALGIKSPHLRKVKDGPHRPARDVCSAKSGPATVSVMLESFYTHVPRTTMTPRIPSAPPGRTEYGRRQDKMHSRPASHQPRKDVTFNSKPVSIEPSEDYSYHRSTPNPSSVGSVSSGRAKSAPCRERMLQSLGPGYGEAAASRVGQCPVALRRVLMGKEDAQCRCSRHKIPHITDIEYDEMVFIQLPAKQLVVIGVFSSLYPSATDSVEMLERLYEGLNKNRTRPCLQAQQDHMRLFLYDTATAAEFTDHSQPLLLRRHNVIPGMFLMYKGGRLLFCDHIFNGYGNAKKDFQKQIAIVQRASSRGHYLLSDFRFSPLKGRRGMRAAWGGEIGGAGVDRHGNTGLALKKHTSKSSLTSTNSSDSFVFHHESGLQGPMAKVIRLDTGGDVYGSLDDLAYQDYLNSSLTSQGFSYISVPSLNLHGSITSGIQA